MLRDASLSPRQATTGVVELRELLIDAWRKCVPKKVAAAYEGLPDPGEDS